MTTFMHVVGARPNLVKVAPVMAAIGRASGVKQVLVHTGQHYDVEMSGVFLAELGLPQPDVNLGVGSGTHAWQTAEVMTRFEPELQRFAPDWVIVYGDVNSTLAAALVAAKLANRVAHVEAGLRSFDRTMPEEINRVLTDQLAHLLFTTEESANTNLLSEGIPLARIRFVGNVMIDSLVRLLPSAERVDVLARLGIDEVSRFCLVTLHRPNNVDEGESLRIIALALGELARSVPVIFAVHPRTRKSLEQHGLLGELAGCQLLPPLGYLDFLTLQRRASVVITDSGGVQEETTFLRVPCLTVRPNTERPVTIVQGSNRLVEIDKDALVGGALRALEKGADLHRPLPPLWDGHAADRVAAELLEQGA